MLHPGSVRVLSCSALLAALMLTPACKGDQYVNMPEAPDMSPVRALFASPTGSLAKLPPGELVTLLQQNFLIIDELGAFQVLSDTLSAFMNPGGEGAQEAGLETTRAGLQAGETSLDGKGYLIVTRTCPGTVGAATPDPADGQVELTVVFDEQGFRPVAWGLATDCRFKSGDKATVLDADYSISFGDRHWSQSQPPQELLFDVVGTVLSDGKKTIGTWDFRYLDPGRFELNLETSTGNVIFFAEGELRGFLSADGPWSCDFEEMKCSSADSLLSLL